MNQNIGLILGVVSVFILIPVMIILSEYLWKKDVIAVLWERAVKKEGREITPLQKVKKQTWMQCYEYNRDINIHMLHYCIPGDKSAHIVFIHHDEVWLMVNKRNWK